MISLIGKYIKDYRKERGWTQEELAQKSGMSKISIGNYERGDRCPTLDNLQKIADALEVPVNCFVDGTEYRQLVRADVANYTGDGLLAYLQHLNCNTYSAKENGRRGYYIEMKKESKFIFIDFEILDRIEAMAEADIKKLLVTFGVVPKKIGGE